jgi:hypothetical protein
MLVLLLGQKGACEVMPSVGGHTSTAFGATPIRLMPTMLNNGPTMINRCP